MQYDTACKRPQEMLPRPFGMINNEMKLFYHGLLAVYDVNTLIQLRIENWTLTIE